METVEQADRYCICWQPNDAKFIKLSCGHEGHKRCLKDWYKVSLANRTALVCFHCFENLTEDDTILLGLTTANPYNLHNKLRILLLGTIGTLIFIKYFDSTQSIGEMMILGIGYLLVNEFFYAMKKEKYRRKQQRLNREN